MSINHEVKGQLAKLLATENLVIEHKKVETACFNVDTRVLTLPLWERASSTVYDLLVGHEVGHALYTPNEDWSSIADVPRDYVNVVEDARVERLMKRRYPGLSKTFYRGYNELDQDDFFGIKETDVAKLSLIDRINLHFKVGAYSCIPFSEDEKVFVDLVLNTETFSEVLEACKKIYEYVKEKQKDQLETPSELSSESVNTNRQGSGTASDVEQGESQDDASEQENTSGSNTETTGNSKGDQESQNQDQDLSPDGDLGGDKADEDVSVTQRSFDQEAQKLNKSNLYSSRTVYIEHPKLLIDNIVVDNKEIHSYISEQFNAQEKFNKENAITNNTFGEVDKSFEAYKKQSQKEVNYLVKEFECKKSADAYQRSSVSRTGVLDTSKLHTYKYNEDLFKKVTVVPDGKNHGLLFLLDWSGSMSGTIFDTFKQLLNLCWFCKKVQIPFDVYAFTYDWNPRLVGKLMMQSSEKVVNTFHIPEYFHLINLLSSTANNKDFDSQAKNVWRIVSMYDMSPDIRYNIRYTIPSGLDLSGTPLNESILAMSEIIPKFQQKNKVQKVNLITLTDGESNGIAYNMTYHCKYSDKDKFGTNSVGNDCILRDRKTGNVYRSFAYEYNSSVTSILLENLKDRFPYVNIIGFRVAKTSEFTRLYKDIMNITTYGNNSEVEGVSKIWKKDGSYEIKQSKYDSLYVISSSNLSENAAFSIDTNASLNDIKTSFRKMLKAKTTNKKLLSSFASLVS
jgi:hypothetical protein